MSEVSWTSIDEYKDKLIFNCEIGTIKSTSIVWFSKHLRKKKKGCKYRVVKKTINREVK